MADDYYALLGVPKDASAQEIKRAYRTLAKELHPDVTGDDPAKVERFKLIKAAYEVLSDPVDRERYDRRNERRGPSPFYGSHWRHAGSPASSPGRSASNPMNDLDLDDLVNSFGQPDFGFGQKNKASRSSTPPFAARPSAGRDIPVTVNVPAETAMAGGTVTVTYSRLKRADDQHTLYRYDEIYDLRIPPGTQHGETMRIERMGDAGTENGPWGDLVCDIRVVTSGRPPPPPSAGPKVHFHTHPGAGAGPRRAGPEPGAHTGPGRMKMPRAAGAEQSDAVHVNVGVVEAILGGRVEVDTPSGKVRITIPPGTSSGTRLRLRGRGWGGEDLFAEVRIVVPKEIDEESRSLIERFGELNPSTED